MQLKPSFQIAICLFGLLPFGPIIAQEALTVEQCRQMALANSPLNVQKANAATIAVLQTEGLRASGLPKIGVGGQVSYQSDVFGLPIESPFFKVPAVPKDQYKLNVDVSQRIWDGNSDKVRKQQYALDSELASAQTGVDIFSLRELVTDLFFRALLLQESEIILNTSKTDLTTRLKQVEGAIAEGVMLRTNADQIKIQILKIEQQITATQSDRQALLEILGLWIGHEKVDFTLTLPRESASLSLLLRPEIQLFELRERQLDVAMQMIGLRKQPKVEAFAQGGIGSPNPLNFFEEGLYGLVGIRAMWTPFDWGLSNKDKQVLEVQKKNIAAQRSAFGLRMAASARKEERAETKNRAMLAQDDTIIAIQESIVARADAQVKNGLMTMTDYLAQVNLLTQAQLTQKTHELQAIQARENLIAMSCKL
jgi:outer membrane protein